MRKPSILMILFLLVACDPYQFGFNKNPAYVLDETFKAVMNQDAATFLELTAKETLCVYGNEAGINYLKKHLQFNPEEVEIKHSIQYQKHHPAPKYVGYWSYYHERYEIDIKLKSNLTPIMKAIVDCDYGTDEEKDDKYLNRKREEYKKKECRLIKIIPEKFPALEVPEKCSKLRVNLEPL